MKEIVGQKGSLQADSEGIKGRRTRDNMDDNKQSIPAR